MRWLFILPNSLIVFPHRKFVFYTAFFSFTPTKIHFFKPKNALAY